MLDKIRKFLNEYQLLAPGDCVLAAVSGGADSVCLLSVLRNLMPEFNIEVRALHLHHGLRGKEADRDAEFVRAMCASWGIPLILICRDVADYAREHKYSMEEAGRILRYEVLEQEADQWEREHDRKTNVRIAIAHHQDDNVETILHHFLRGSGLRGLSGMRPKQGRRIRPLLCVRRKEICAYLREIDQEWCEDSTNEGMEYTRNRIRNHLLPLMEQEVNTRVAENILRAGQLFAQADIYLMEQAQKVFESIQDKENECVKTEGRISIPLMVFFEQPPILRSYIIRIMLDTIALGQKNLTSKHFKCIEELAKGRVGTMCNLPGDLRAGRDYTSLWVGKMSKERDKMPQSFEDKFFFNIFFIQKDLEIPKNRYTKWFDYGKIKDTLSVRTRQSGDYITIRGGGKKTVNRFMIDEKIPKEERDKILLLTEGSHVLWIVGYRISEYYKITAATEKILQVQVNKGEENG